MSKMTDEQIIKALECCMLGDCQGCFYGDTDQRHCKDDLMKNTLDLINRQQSAIDVYMRENDRLKTAYIQVSMDRDEIRGEIEAWKQINQGLYNEMEERRKEDIGIAKEYARIGAIKECLEKIEQMDVSESDDYIMVKKYNFDNLVKEMVGEGK